MCLCQPSRHLVSMVMGLVGACSDGWVDVMERLLGVGVLGVRALSIGSKGIRDMLKGIEMMRWADHYDIKRSRSVY